jgi:hypothetical protein
MSAVISPTERASRALALAWRSARDHVSRSLPAPGVPRSALGVALLVTVQLLSLFALSKSVKKALGPMVRNPAPPAIPQPTSMMRFGMTEDRRREVFRELAEAEVTERRRAIEQNTWGGHAWSREDDLGYVQRARAREVAARYGLSLSQMYLVLDEGIRRRWLAPDGEPLRGTSEPINLRTE